MPAIMPGIQKLFKLILNDGQPEGLIKITDQGHTMPCCPLCGCTHQITDMELNNLYTPICQTLPFMFKEQQNLWQKQHPEVIPFKMLQLVQAKS